MDRNNRTARRITKQHVALRKESVDRNLAVWAVEQASSVALRKESVDRNVVILHDLVKCPGRSPQGERG